jgi:hypothetical protein
MTRYLAIVALPFAALAAFQAHAAPRSIDACTTITKPGSYALSDDIVYGGPSTGTCVSVMVGKVSINLDGHTISNGNPPGFGNQGAAIRSDNDTEHVTVRNGVISGFGNGVALGGAGSIVEDMHVGGPCPCQGFGISADGVIKDNVVSVASELDLNYGGIFGSGVIKGNYVYDTRSFGIVAGADSTVTDNTVTGTSGAPGDGMSVACPSTVAHNTITGSAGKNLVLNGEGCTAKDNTAP